MDTKKNTSAKVVKSAKSAKSAKSISVICSVCGKTEWITETQAGELWPAGFEEKHAGYICQTCDAMEPWEE